MPSDIHAQPAQLLNQPPNFRPAGPDLFGNFRAADDHGSVAHQQTDNAAEANVGRFVYGGETAGFGGGCDGGIITSRWSFVVGNRIPNDPTGRTTSDRRPTTGFQAGVTLKLISTAVNDCVSAPTEMKSTPVSA